MQSSNGLHTDLIFNREIRKWLAEIDSSSQPFCQKWSLFHCAKRAGQAATVIMDLSAKPWMPLLVVTAHQKPRRVQ